MASEGSTLRDSVLIPLAGKGGVGKFFLVTTTDAELIRQFSWRLTGRTKRGAGRPCVYVSTQVKRKTIYIHRFLLGLEAGDGEIVDHINNDPLDSRRENLRLVTDSQNKANTKKRAAKAGCSSASIFKGVSRSGKRWTAQIKINGVNRYLGTFDTQEEAASAYNTSAFEQWGEFACPNIIPPAPAVSL